MAYRKLMIIRCNSNKFVVETPVDLDSATSMGRLLTQFRLLSRQTPRVYKPLHYSLDKSFPVTTQVLL